MKYEKEFEQLLADVLACLPDKPTEDDLQYWRTCLLIGFTAGVKAAEPSVKIQAIPALFKPKE